MVWGVFTYIFGVIAVVGPLCLVYWYWRAARTKFKEFQAAANAGDDTAGVPPDSGGGS